MADHQSLPMAVRGVPGQRLEADAVNRGAWVTENYRPAPIIMQKPEEVDALKRGLRCRDGRGRRGSPTRHSDRNLAGRRSAQRTEEQSHRPTGEQINQFGEGDDHASSFRATHRLLETAPCNSITVGEWYPSDDRVESAW